LRLAHDARDDKRMCGVLNGIGMTLTEIGELAAATMAYEEAMTLVNEETSPQFLAAVRNNLALTLCQWAEASRDTGAPESEWVPRARRAFN
jgi:hypothetical protein